MSRVMTFSRVFPEYHPKAGQPTYFVEKVWKTIQSEQREFFINYYSLTDLNPGKEKLVHDFWETITPNYFNNVTGKGHTIRAGHRWKVGDKFSPRVWSGKPYNSKQITIAPDIEVVKVWDFEMIPFAWWDECQFKSKDFEITAEKLELIARNDGLKTAEFVQWFAGPCMMSSKRKPFHGQIICWNPTIDY